MTIPTPAFWGIVIYMILATFLFFYAVYRAGRAYTMGACAVLDGISDIDSGNLIGLLCCYPGFLDFLEGEGIARRSGSEDGHKLAIEAGKEFQAQWLKIVDKALQRIMPAIELTPGGEVVSDYREGWTVKVGDDYARKPFRIVAENLNFASIGNAPIFFKHESEAKAVVAAHGHGELERLTLGKLIRETKAEMVTTVGWDGERLERVIKIE